MNRIRIVIPTMIAVLIMAMWLLEKDFSTISIYVRVFIALGGALLSGVLTFILMKQDVSGSDKKPN
ncbi:hypothetical protein [uncultured Metabacillus sp.]|uniref:hypothetical protein n=1 Tax=uncultured Metabacillus sp. TaxID=2860135 RepID=UPI00262DBAF3|nr:hypothetical protein [uncultured Metabacillus sp.]